jgi:hypothetical protein
MITKATISAIVSTKMRWKRENNDSNKCYINGSNDNNENSDINGANSNTTTINNNRNNKNTNNINTSNDDNVEDSNSLDDYYGNNDKKWRELQQRRGLQNH